MPARKQMEQAEEAVSELGENIAVRFKDALDSASDWRDSAQSYIKKNPGIALAGAFFLGVIVAKVARHA
jgi:hypothetical protein